MAQLILLLLIAGAIFGICYLVDKTFAKLFRSKAQHRSGMAVRANKRYGVFGVILTVLGIMAVCVGVTDGPVLIWGGIIVLLMGIAMAVYYLSFGIFYDGESLLLQRFGKKDVTERSAATKYDSDVFFIYLLSFTNFRFWYYITEPLRIQEQGQRFYPLSLFVIQDYPSTRSMPCWSISALSAPWAQATKWPSASMK